jgi:hypothetical protein
VKASSPKKSDSIERPKEIKKSEVKAPTKKLSSTKVQVKPTKEPTKEIVKEVSKESPVKVAKKSTSAKPEKRVSPAKV